MKRLIQLLILLLAGLFIGQAELAGQAYGSAVGLRLGSPLSVSFKKFLTEENALELYVGTRGYSSFRWVSANAAWQKHKAIDGADGLEYYFGFGAGVQFWTYDFLEESSTTFSVSGYGGLQYTFANAPFSLSIDWVPTFFVGENFGAGFNTFGYSYGALAARYILGRS